MSKNCEGCPAIQFCDAEIAVDQRSLDEWDERSVNVEEMELRGRGRLIIASDDFAQGKISVEEFELTKKLMGEVLDSTQNSARIEDNEATRQRAQEQVQARLSEKSDVLATCSPRASKMATLARRLGLQVCGSTSVRAAIYVERSKRGDTPYDPLLEIQQTCKED